MKFGKILRREFSVTAMRARAHRYDVVAETHHDLQLWKDYGDPEVLRRIIARLTSESEGTND